MEKLSFYGVGPKIGIVAIPWMAATIIISVLTGNTFNYSTDETHVILYGGILLMSLGLAFYFSTVRLLLKGLNETRLVTNGAFSLCQNPLYSAIILFINPALSLLLNSWLVLTTSIIGYVLFKIFIKNEYKDLERIFGDTYRKYKEETPEFFPFPFKKLFR